jgi:hypothetical protein
MKKPLLLCALALALCLTNLQGADLPALNTIITAAEAGKILGAAVAAPTVDKGKDEQEVTYSTCRYESAKKDRALALDVREGGSTRKGALMILNANSPMLKPVSGLGEKAIFFDKGGAVGRGHSCTLHILKGDLLLSVSMTGVEAANALTEEKEIARKILARL